MINPISTIIDAMTRVYESYNSRKRAKEAALSKIAIAKQNGDDNIQMLQTEWEALGKNAEGDGIKDEWTTFVVTLPLLSIFLLSVIAVLTGDPIYAEAGKAGVSSILELLPNFHEILEIVVYAAVSIRVVKGFNRG